MSDVSEYRDALGLGTSATRDVGTTAGTVAAGDDARFGAGGSTSMEVLLGVYDTRNVVYAGGAKCDLRDIGASTASGSTTITGSFLASNGDAGKIACIDGAGAVVASGTDGVMNYAFPDGNKLTSASATFTSAVIGRYITVTGAGSGGATMTARIFGFENANTIRLNAQRGTSVASGATWTITEDLYGTISSSTATNAVLDTAAGRSLGSTVCWLGTDDAPAIQACIDAAAAATGGAFEGSHVYHIGSSAIGTTLYITKPTQFHGAGPRGYSRTLAHSSTKLRLLKPRIGGIQFASSAYGVGLRGSITSGAAVLTDPAANFQSGDVGKLITVYKAGTQIGSSDGSHLNTTIASRASATQVTLAANAGSTLSGNAFYQYGPGTGYPVGFAAPGVRKIHIEGGPGQLFGVHAPNVNEFVFEEVCCSDFRSGIGFIVGTGPSPSSFGNQNEMRSCYANDNMIGIYQDRGAIMLTGQNFIEGNSNLVNCNATGTIGIHANVLVATGAHTTVQAYATGIKCIGQGGASGVFGNFAMENVPIMFDVASDGQFGSWKSLVNMDTCGNSNANGGYQLLLKAGVRHFQYNPGFYLDEDMALLHPSCDAQAVRELQLGAQFVAKPGPISDGAFLHAPLDKAMGINTLTNQLFVRIGGGWRYLPTTGLATRGRLIDNAQGNAVSSRTFVNTGAAIPVGHHVIIGLGYSSTSTLTVTASDTAGNTYAVDGHADMTTAQNPHAVILSAKVTTQIPNGGTITATLSGSAGEVDGFAYEYSGMAPSAHLDQTAGATGNGTAIATANITTTQASEVVVMAAYTAWTAGFVLPTVSAGTGWTLADTQGNSGVKRLSVLDQNVFATGTLNGTATQSAVSDWAAVICSYKAAP